VREVDGPYPWLWGRQWWCLALSRKLHHKLASVLFPLASIVQLSSHNLAEFPLSFAAFESRASIFPALLEDKGVGVGTLTAQPLLARSMSARKRHAVSRSKHDVADAPEKSCHPPDDGAICRWSGGIKPLAMEVRFQADQGRHVVWVRSLEWCPPLLALLRGRARAKIVHPQAVFAHVMIAVALVACKTYLHMQQPEENTELSEAFLLSGWILYLTSSLLLPACSFHWLVRLGSLLVGGTILLRHDDEIGMVSKYVFCCCCCSAPTSFLAWVPARNPTHPHPFQTNAMGACGGGGLSSMSPRAHWSGPEVCG